MPLKQPDRDSVTTINDDGSHYMVHPADVKGPFSYLRKFSAWGMIAVYIFLPWIPIGGHPAVFLDVLHGQFHLFGLTLVAQDLWLLFFVITGVGFTLFYLTALFGRLWCGWGCPQTVFLEHVFRSIERLIDGDAIQRRKLDAAPLGPIKVAKRFVKHSLFILFSLIITHIFISYFISLPRLYEMMQESPLENWGIFVFVTGFAVILYGNFAWFREQFCIVLCPYGRFQSALLDEHSLIIGYDEKRGEPRGKASDPANGDCIDCHRCVQVCPTGIDIRQGLQMECIGCANCIDACDEIMTKLDRPKGLVRYDSQTGLEGGKTKFIRPRILLYSVLLLIGASIMSYSLAQVRPANLSVTRLPGAPYILNQQEMTVRNNYYVGVINKQGAARSFELKVSAPDGIPFEQNGFAEPVSVPAEGEIRSTLILVLNQERFKETGAFEITVELVPVDGGRSLIKTIKFLGPDF
jgi:cytochrome c oxidase accessory protein FixG